MSDRTTLRISIPIELARFVEARIAAGPYRSASEVVGEALRLLEERDRTREEALDAVREKIAIGLEQARRGELRDGDQVFEELFQRLSPAGEGE